jgi:ribose 5-phosphate isomerase A
MLLDPEALKREAALAALEHVPADEALGLGSGSTVNHFIDVLATSDERPRAAVAASTATEERLRDVGIDVVGLSDVSFLPVYIDGADEIDPRLRMIKGGGGALTREKICAQAASTFVCIADATKRVEHLGKADLPVEVVPMATRLVTQALRELGGSPTLREGFVTDNGGVILDTRGLDLSNPEALEVEIDSCPGVIASGLFARRRADVALIAGAEGVREITPRSTPPL